MRFTIFILLLCDLHCSLALLNFLPDPAVEDGAPPPLVNFATGQPIAGLPQTFDNEQPGAKHPWDEPSSFDTALNVQSEYQISDANRDCGRAAGAKFRKRGSFCSQTPAQQPASSPKSPTNPEDLPTPKNHPGVPSEDYQDLNDLQFGARSPWMTRMLATEDDESEMCGKAMFVVCDSGNPYFRVPQLGTPYYALSEASFCKFLTNSVGAKNCILTVRYNSQPFSTLRITKMDMVLQNLF